MHNFILISKFSDIPPFLYIIPFGIIIYIVITLVLVKRHRNEKVDEVYLAKRNQKINAFSTKFETNINLYDREYLDHNLSKVELIKLLQERIGLVEYILKREYVLDLIMEDNSLEQIMKNLKKNGLDENDSFILLKIIILHFNH